jgi:archaellum component FlaC
MGSGDMNYYEDLLIGKDKQIDEMKETIEIMDLKIKKLEQLI